MSLENLAALMTEALALMASPGPATLSAAAAGAAYRGRALRYVAGISSGTMTVMVLASVVTMIPR